MHVWLRAENKDSERRTPLTPEGAKILLQRGHNITVEKSINRIFIDQEYEDIGCTMREAGEWVNAPREAYILGLKELPELPSNLVHRHIFFGHAYKGQTGSHTLLDRFRRGGGKLLDLEYLADSGGRRVAAFGYWAGYIGASLALIHFAKKTDGGLRANMAGFLPSTDQVNLDKATSSSLNPALLPRVLIIGANGRSGTGAKDICLKYGIKATEWEKKDTAYPNYNELLQHDILINCALITHAVPPFLDWKILNNSRKLSLVADISCDQGTALNPLPIVNMNTTWADPVHQLLSDSSPTGPLAIIAINNLPTLLPRESSLDFSAAALPHLLNLDIPDNEYWLNAHRAYTNSIAKNTMLLSNTPYEMKP